MLNNKYRATRTNIELTTKTGLPIFGKYLYAKISKKETEKIGFAIIVSKKYEKTSVGRHRIKRKISSYIENNLLEIKTNIKKTIVFFIKKNDTPLVFDDVEKDVDFILNKTVL